jgi:hypothetical protein
MGFAMSKLAWGAIDAGAVPKTPERIVLLAIADYAKDKAGDLRGTCWPSVERIAQRTGQNKRTVQRALGVLSLKGLVSILPRSHDRRNVYRLAIARLEVLTASAESIGDTESPVEGTQRSNSIGDTPPPVPPTDDTQSPEHVTLTTSTRDSHDILYRKNLEENLEQKPAAAGAPERQFDFADEYSQVRPRKPQAVTRKQQPLTDADVERIRLAYPKKEGPVPARKAIRAQHALLVRGEVTTAAGPKLPKMTPEAATAYLLSQATEYARSPNLPADPRFIPLPATWLNSGNYTVARGSAPTPMRTLADKLAAQRVAQ